MSCTCLLTHIVFSTKERASFLNDEQLRHDTHACLGGIVRNMESRAYTIGGVADHVHRLVSTTPTLAIADLVRTIKTNSSKWLPERIRFAWQQTYSVFSVSQSNCDRVAKYIDGQEQHHRRRTLGTTNREMTDVLVRLNDAVIEPAPHGHRLPIRQHTRHHL